MEVGRHRSGIPHGDTFFSVLSAEVMCQAEKTADSSLLVLGEKKRKGSKQTALFVVSVVFSDFSTTCNQSKVFFAGFLRPLRP